MRLEGLGRVVQDGLQAFDCPGGASVHGNGTESGDCKDGKQVGDPPAVGSNVPGIGTCSLDRVEVFRYNRPLRSLAGRFLSASIEPSELFKFRLSGQFQALYLT